MKINWLTHYADYLANTEAPWTGVLPLLAEQLGVSEASLRSLGVGFAPLVQFKKKSSPFWWVTPERDTEGDIVGLSLRSDRDGSKFMFPGSKHGLCYPIRPGFKTGTKEYVPGRHNWVRTMDAGVLCPVCNKPDGCLVSAENVADPKAVICIREKKGSVSLGNLDKGGGNLHIRKAEGHVSRGSPLPDSEWPIIIVEGMSDAAAALDMGFISVGRPSNLAGLGFLKQLLRSRKCIVVGENDKQPDGRWPGRDGVEAVFETMRATSETVKVFPPEDVKDLREWVRKYALTKESFLEYVTHYGSNQGDSRTLDSKEPVSIAVRWIKEEHTVEGIPVLRKYGGEWFRFDGRRYETVDEEAYIRGGLYRWLLARFYKSLQDDGGIKLVAYDADKGKLTNIIDALLMDCPLLADPPCWLDGRTTPHPKYLVSFPNGVLDVNAYIRDGSNSLMATSPMLFTLNALPYDYDPDARCPVFLKAVGEILPDDPKKILLLQEWMGYLLIPDMSEQKLMVWNGASGTGKTTLLGAVGAMLGPDQCCYPTLNSLSQQWGLGALVGKLAAIVGDAGLDITANKQQLMERLKELSGNISPRMNVPRRYKDDADILMSARLMIACNELPDLPDSGGALPRRTLALQFTQQFTEASGRKPDKHLPERIAAEAPGIFNWALEGLDRLKRNGEFTIPASSEELAKKFAQNASPITQFTEYCCKVGSNDAVPEEVLYEAWKNWAREHGLSAGMRLKFKHNLMLNVSSIRCVQDLVDAKPVSVFHGINLTTFAREKYLVR